MTKIRLVQEADIPEVVALGAAMHAESSFAPLTFAPEKVAEFIRQGMGSARRESALVMVAEDKGRIVGGMYGDIVVPWYTEHAMGIEHFLYVRPECRGGLAGMMMLRSWVKWCIDSGVTQIRPGTAAAIGSGADRLYAGHGFSCAGNLYVLNREQFSD